MKLLSILLLSGCFLGTVLGAADGPIVEIADGQIQGDSQQTRHGKAFTAFVGIPYAQPPLGDLRFRAPVPVEPWTGIRDGSIEGESCVQPYFAVPKPASGSEDCLTLSVFSPSTFDGTDSFPVHVFIHGGGYFIGEDDEIHYGPDRFIDNSDMVIVFMNYRLGTFGFLCTEDDNAPGNFGMLDQNLALKWVQTNIAAFGGNPNDVTISGESAGAASVMFHILSPMSTGLFHQAITESGTALNPWALQEHPLHYAQLVAEQLGCPTTTNAELVDCLRTIEAYTLSDGELAVMVENLTLAFVPVVETAPSGQFLTEDPLTLLTEGRFNQVPLISGFNRDEGILIYGFTIPFFQNINEVFFNDTVPLLLTVLTDYRVNLQEISYAIKDEYYNIDLNDPDAVVRASVDMLSDMFMRSWCIQTVNLFTAQGLDVYLYDFIYEGDFYYTNFTGGADITHTYELLFLYNITDVAPTIDNRDTLFAENQFVPLWANFINQGVPSPSGTPTWNPTPSGRNQFLSIDEAMEFSLTNYDEGRMTFWLETVPAIVAGTAKPRKA